MSSYSILGFGRARSPWLTSVSTWANSGSLPASFTKCVSSAEATQRIRSLQPWSALLIDAQLATGNQGLIDAAASAGVPVFVVGEASILGTSTVELPNPLALSDLATALTVHGRMLNEALLDNVHSIVEAVTTWQGKLIAVCGPGGAGASSVAISIAQGLGTASVDDGSVLLADFARNHEQAMLHDVATPSTSVEDAVSLHRLNHPDSGALRNLCLSLPSRNYVLLPGMLKQSAWSTFSHRSIENTVNAMTMAFLHTVVDITADFEGEAESGSSDVEERNALARISALKADVVVVVGAPGVKGTHSIARSVRELNHLGVSVEQILVVVNRASKSILIRGAQRRAIQDLVGNNLDIVFAREFPIDAAIHDGVALPAKFVRAVYEPLREKLDTTNSVNQSEPEYERIEPGSFGFGSADAS